MSVHPYYGVDLEVTYRFTSRLASHSAKRTALCAAHMAKRPHAIDMMDPGDKTSRMEARREVRGESVLGVLVVGVGVAEVIEVFLLLAVTSH